MRTQLQQRATARERSRLWLLSERLSQHLVPLQLDHEEQAHLLWTQLLHATNWNVPSQKKKTRKKFQMKAELLTRQLAG